VPSYKTGTLEGVRTLAGYASTSKHGRVRFVIALRGNNGAMRFRAAQGDRVGALVLKQIAPSSTRAAVIRDPAITAGIGQWAAIQAVAPTISMQVVPVNVRDASEIERAVAEFARTPNGGLIVTGSGLAIVHLALIVKLAARHKLPAVYYERSFTAAGGLVSYGADLVDQYRQAAGYIDRILKGEKPADLPVQAPTRYETVINLKTAKALGLTVPPSVLARQPLSKHSFEPIRCRLLSLERTCDGASSSRLSAAQWRCPSWCMRRSGCGASACS
jgi:hypothetical protein